MKDEKQEQRSAASKRRAGRDRLAMAIGSLRVVLLDQTSPDPNRRPFTDSTTAGLIEVLKQLRAIQRRARRQSKGKANG